MTVCIVHYNTPKLTSHCIRSLLKHHPSARVIIFDNSDLRPFSSVCCDTIATHIEVIDNTRAQILDFNTLLAQFPDKETGPINKSNYGSYKHCCSVQWLMDHLDEPFLLMDSDVLIRQRINTFCNPRYAFTGHVVCNTRKRFGLEIYRAEPFLCYINTPMLRGAGVTYLNTDYMWALSHQSPNNRYDTGAWFLKDVIDHRLPYRDIDTEPYIAHFGHGSWHATNYRQWLAVHRDLWQ
jgi:hypothetical protein